MQKYDKLIINTDGGARGNPGPAAIGVVIADENGKILKKYSKFLGEKTNNEAEYEAIIAALELAQRMGAEAVIVNLDSELAARQLNNIYRTRDKRMQEFLLRVRNLETNFKKVNYRHVPRQKNKLADQLVNECLDAQE